MEPDQAVGDQADWQPAWSTRLTGTVRAAGWAWCITRWHKPARRPREVTCRVGRLGQGQHLSQRCLRRRWSAPAAPMSTGQQLISPSGEARAAAERGPGLWQAPTSPKQSKMRSAHWQRRPRARPAQMPHSSTPRPSTSWRRHGHGYRASPSHTAGPPTRRPRRPPPDRPTRQSSPRRAATIKK